MHVRALRAILAPLLTLAACGGGDQPPTEPGSDARSVATVRVMPSSAKLAALGASRDFEATARNQDGTAMSGVQFRWAAAPGSVATVDDEGRATAQGPGRAAVRAEAIGHGAADTASLAVDPVARSLVVRPSADTVTEGGTATYSAEPRDANDHPVSADVGWWSLDSATATVDSAGTATGREAGTAGIVAEAPSGVRDTGALIVTGGDDGGGGGEGSVDTVFYDGFESGDLSAWDDGVDPDLHHVRSDAEFAASGSRYLEITYPDGEDGGWLTRFFMPGYDSVYVSYRVRLEKGWRGDTKLLALYGSRTDNRWSAHGKAGVCPEGDDFFTTMVITSGSGDPGPLRFYTYYPEMKREPDGETCYGDHGPADYGEPVRLEPGTWHRLGFWVRVNEVGREDAAQRFFLDGGARAEWTGFAFRTSDILRINSVQITASAQAPRRQHLYVDDFLVATGVPGSGPP